MHPGSAGHLRQAYVDAAVDLLKQKFGLSLFGFDIVVVWSGTPSSHEACPSCLDHSLSYELLMLDAVSLCSQMSDLVSSCHCWIDPIVGTQRNLSKSVVVAGRHYIVDVNYFPSFKDVPDAKEHLWALLKQAHARWR